MNTGNAGTVLFNSSSNIYKFVVASGLILSAPYSIPNTQIFTDTLPCAPPLPTIPWCEGFTSTTFPPTGWTLTGPNTSYLFRATVSGFGLGVGSAQWDCWNGSSGNQADLGTMQFAPTVTNDSVSFDLAYCLYSASSPDSLVIYASTNNGTSYSLVIGYGPVELVTTNSCTSPFTPSASDWQRRGKPLPVGTNLLKFHAYSGFGDSWYLDSICVKHALVGIHTNSNNIPNVYSLSQNYPNPFNPSTKISFGLPKAGNVEIKIYDLLGREVTTLVNEFKTAGSYSVDFNASNLASGVYFYSIKSGNFTDTKKMVLMK
jgi:hypothetical protein